jgi:hypothetical protein
MASQLNNTQNKKLQNMKKLIILIAIAMFSETMIAQANKIVEPPQPVSAAFASRFPNAQLKKWELRKEGYIADFRLDGRKLFAYYAADGSWKGTETPIKWTKNLPAAVKEGWRNGDYSAWTVLDIKRIETPEQPLYTLHVNNGNLLDANKHDAYLEEYVLFFNEKGEMVRKDRMP